MDYKEFLVKYSWAIQLAGVVAFGWLATWIAGRSRPKMKDGWVYAGYTFPIKIVSAGFVVFIVAALGRNGAALFKEDWWVPPVIFAMTASAFWLAYDVFFTTLRWHEEALELHRLFLPSKAIRICDITTIEHHPFSQAVSIVDRQGQSIRFNVGYRMSTSNLLACIHNANSVA